jgi:hypothetical protein
MKDKLGKFICVGEILQADQSSSSIRPIVLTKVSESTWSDTMNRVSGFAHQTFRVTTFHTRHHLV